MCVQCALKPSAGDKWQVEGQLVLIQSNTFSPCLLYSCTGKWLFRPQKLNPVGFGTLIPTGNLRLVFGTPQDIYNSIRSAFEILWHCWSEKYFTAQPAKYLRLLGSKVWQRVVAGGRLDHGAAGSLTYGGGPCHGREVLLSRALNCNALHCNPNCSARQCSTSLYPASVYWSWKCRQEQECTWHERKSLPLCSHPPSSGWGNSTKWVMRKSLRSQKFAQLPRTCQDANSNLHTALACWATRPPFFLLQQIVDNNYNQKIAAGSAATGLHANEAM